MKIANINNLSLVSVAMERLVNRMDGLPGLGVLYGPSGFGKTTATVAVANETRAYYVQLRSAWSKKTLLEKICFEMGLPPARTAAGCLDLICEQLAASQRPLILDEADYLVIRDVLARASSIRQTKQSAASGLVFRYSISEQSKDDREMAYLMMGGYHTAEDGQGGLKSLPPFFPGDSAWVSADWDRSIKYKTDFFADPAAYAAQSEKQPATSRPVGIVQKAAGIERKILAFPYIKQIAIGFSVLILLAVFKSLSTADRFRFVFFAIMLLLPLLVWWIWRGIRNGR